MASFACSDCQRNVECACLGCLSLLCEEHRLHHSSSTHCALGAFLLVPDSGQLKQQLVDLHSQYAHLKHCVSAEGQQCQDTKHALIQLERHWRNLHETSSAQSWGEGELATWLSIGRGLSLQGECRYQESCSVLENQWSRVYSVAGREVLVLALALAEVMGLHIGRYKEALAVLDQSLQVAHRILPQSEEAFQLTNMKAAVLTHQLMFRESEDLCISAIQSFGAANHSEETYGTALYLLVIPYFDLRPQVGALALQWTERTKHSSSSVVQHIRLVVSAALAGREENWIDAEVQIREAEQLANQHFPTSNYSALCAYLKDRVVRKVLQLKDDEKFHYLEEELCLRTHFPTSLLRADILAKNAQYCRHVNDFSREIELRQQAHSRLQVNPQCALFMENVTSLEEAFFIFNQSDKAFELRYSAYCTSISADASTCDFSKYFGTLNFFLTTKYEERLIPAYTEILQKLEIAHPTDRHFSEVLGKLVTHLAAVGQGDRALSLCLEKHKMLSTQFPNSASYAASVEVLAQLYEVLGMREKCIETYLEGLHRVQTNLNFHEYKELAASFLARNPQFPKDIRLKVMQDAHQFLLSNASAECIATLAYLIESYSDQPTKAQELMLEVYEVLQMSPTCLEFEQILGKLTEFYKGRGELEKAIQLRMEAHRVLQRHTSSINFLCNLQELANCLVAAKQQEAALECLLEGHRLLLSEPNSAVFEGNLGNLISLCNRMARYTLVVQVLLEVCPIVDKSKSIWIFAELEKAYCKLGDFDAALQVKLTHLNHERIWRSEYIRVLNSAIGLCVELQKHEAAVQLGVEALHTMQERHVYHHVSGLLWTLDEVLERMGQVDRAIGLREQALRELERNRVTGKYDELLKPLVALCMRNGQVQRASGAYLEALKFMLLQSPNSVQTFNILTAAGDFYWNLGEAGKAEVLLYRMSLICNRNLSRRNLFMACDSGAIRRFYSD